MIRLTLTLPTTAAELRDYLDGLDVLGLAVVDTDIDSTDDTAVMLVGTAATTAAQVTLDPPAAPEPAKVAKALPHAAKVAKRAADQAPKATKRQTLTAGGDTAEAILTALEKAGGRWNGSASAFVKHAGLGHHALNVLPKLALAGRIRLLKPSPTGRVTAIELANTPANVTAISQPPTPRQPAPPATPPISGLKAPAGGWA